jgi:hypothetical protein
MNNRSKIKVIVDEYNQQLKASRLDWYINGSWGEAGYREFQDDLKRVVRTSDSADELAERVWGIATHAICQSISAETGIDDIELIEETLQNEVHAVDLEEGLVQVEEFMQSDITRFLNFFEKPFAIE